MDDLKSKLASMRGLLRRSGPLVRRSGPLARRSGPLIAAFLLLAGFATPSVSEGAKAALKQGRTASRTHRARSGNDSRPEALGSKDLWATVNFCSSEEAKGASGSDGTKGSKGTNGSPTSGGPPSIGIRGSMPPDGHPKDMMFMRFALQYLMKGSSKWHDLPGEAESGFVEAGPATGVRQAGRSFRLKPLSKGESFRLRGLVEFQWRHEGRVVLNATRLTTAGHHDASGARPKGFSAATCEIK